MRRHKFVVNLVSILLFTALGFAVMGYHPGAEDDGVYLTAIKADLNPTLYPHDSDFFRLQLQATLFDGIMARFVYFTGISVAWSELLWQFLSLLGILWACRSIARRLFSDAAAQWAAVAMVSAMFTLPVAGTALYLADQHLHPRNLAVALVLFAVSCLLGGKRLQALPLLLFAIVLHPIVGALGTSFCCFLAFALLDPIPFPLGVTTKRVGKSLAAAAPLGWIFQPPSPPWREALMTRTYYFLYRWAWYEWLGAVAPLVLFLILWRIAKARGDFKLARFALAVFAYGVFQQAIAMIILGPETLIRLTPFQPMRFLHLIYIFLCLIAGAVLGKYILKATAWRWAIFLLLANGGMFIAQRQLFAGSPHIELPAVQSSNPWLQAFEWIRHNTPEDAYFALDPNYMAAPGEDYHSFRALAERSMLSDAIKDAAVVTQVPSLAPAWHQQQLATSGWPRFQVEDFKGLRAKFGVDWVLVSNPQGKGLHCVWHNGSLSVCQIP